MSLLQQYINMFDLPDDFQFSADKNDLFSEDNCVARLRSCMIPDVEMEYPENPYTKEIEDYGSYRLENGKYKGQMIRNVPKSYLRWYVNSAFVPNPRHETLVTYTANKIIDTINNYLDEN